MKRETSNTKESANSGSISILNATTMRQRQIQSKSSFFEAGRDYIIKVDDKKIVITRPNIDSNCRTYKATKISSGWIRFQILAELPLGTFEFDSNDSDVDRAVIYYR